MNNEERDYSILFKLMSMTRSEAKKYASDSQESKKRIDKYRNDAAGFIKYYFPEYIRLEPPEWQKALLDIISHPTFDSGKNVYTWRVTKEQAERLRRWERSEYKYLTNEVDVLRIITLVASREMGKSSVFVRLVLIYLAVYKYLRYGVIFRDTDETADEFLKDTMEEFETNERLIADFGHLKGSLWRDGQYYLNNGVAFTSRGRGSSVRGLIKGPFRPDFIWLDDMTTDKDKRSSIQMDKTYDWIKAAVMGLSKNATILYVNTIFNSDDPMQRIQEEIALGKQPGGLAVRFAAALNDGSSIWSEYWSEKDIENKRREVGSAIFDIEYMCAVLESEERILKKDYFVFRPEHEILSLSDYVIHFGIDPQAEGTDDAAICVSGKSLITGHIDTIDAWERDAANIQTFVDKLIFLFRKYSPQQITWEANSFANTYQKLLREILEHDGIYLPIVPINATGSKSTRALFLQPYLQNGTITINEKLKDSDFLLKLYKFPTKGLNDGPVDAFYYSVIGFFSNFSRPSGSAATKRNTSLPGLLGRYRNV